MPLIGSARAAVHRPAGRHARRARAPRRRPRRPPAPPSTTASTGSSSARRTAPASPRSRSSACTSRPTRRCAPATSATPRPSATRTMAAEMLLARLEATAAEHRPVEQANLVTGEALMPAPAARTTPSRGPTPSPPGRRAGRPYEAAQARWREAEARLATGDRDGAAAVRGRAALTAARELGAAWLRSEVEGFAARARLRGDGRARRRPCRGPLRPHPTRAPGARAARRRARPTARSARPSTWPRRPPRSTSPASSPSSTSAPAPRPRPSPTGSASPKDAASAPRIGWDVRTHRPDYRRALRSWSAGMSTGSRAVERGDVDRDEVAEHARATTGARRASAPRGSKTWAPPMMSAVSVEALAGPAGTASGVLEEDGREHRAVAPALDLVVVRLRQLGREGRPGWRSR